MTRILITAGPTREAIDPVRFLSNRSTGKMGYAIAQAAIDAGYSVTLVSGPVNLLPPIGLAEFVSVTCAAEMYEAVMARASKAEAVIMTAAVADYRPKTVHSDKMKKSDGSLVLELERTQDILAALGRVKPEGQRLIGFAAETRDLAHYATDKLRRKNLDWICANDVSRNDAGFGVDTNAMTLYGNHGEIIELSLDTKLNIAQKILEITLK